MSYGEVDTLGLLFEKLEKLFDESQGYYESFLDTNNMYKKGQISDKEFFQKLGDYTVAYSALEFLAIKVIFELRKSQSSGSANTQSPGLMPGMGQPGMMAGGMAQPPRGTPQNPVGGGGPGGGPPGIVSAQEAFATAGTLPSPDPALMPRKTAPQQQSANGCSSCGAELRPNSKFCTKCGSKA
ncbi:MAG TPA: zinc ribbon domain-containing protein [Nitrosopumilus sp.]|jgi:hypothetical protein|nr:zinc ribbon domain-containing protein [Nitrosopumilus sp.]HJM79829.1 zinc ribbon domain-containing protein [Nitrosopumilus sp.]